MGFRVLFAVFAAVYILWTPLSVAGTRRICDRLLNQIESAEHYKDAYSHLTSAFDELTGDEKYYLLSVIRYRVGRGWLSISENERKILDQLYLDWSKYAGTDLDHIEGPAIRDMKKYFAQVQTALEGYLKSDSTSLYLRTRFFNALEKFEGALGNLAREMDSYSFSREMIQYLEGFLADTRLDGTVRHDLAETVSLLRDQDPEAMESKPIYRHYKKSARLDRKLITVIDALLDGDVFARTKLEDIYEYLKTLKNPLDIDYCYPILRWLASMNSIAIQDQQAIQQVLIQLQQNLRNAQSFKNPYSRVFATNAIIRVDPMMSDVENVPVLLMDIWGTFSQGKSKELIQLLFRLSRTFDPQHELEVFDLLERLQKEIQENPMKIKRISHLKFTIMMISGVFSMHEVFIHNRRDSLIFILFHAPGNQELKRELKLLDEIGGTAHELQIQFF